MKKPSWGPLVATLATLGLFLLYLQGQFFHMLVVWGLAR